MEHSLAGRVCLFTGATRGIGRAIAQGLAQRGARVVLVARSPAAGDMVATKLQEATGNHAISALQGDLSSQASIRRLAAEFGRRYDRLRVLVNCAGVFKGPAGVQAGRDRVGVCHQPPGLLLAHPPGSCVKLRCLAAVHRRAESLRLLACAAHRDRERSAAARAAPAGDPFLGAGEAAGAFRRQQPFG